MNHRCPRQEWLLECICRNTSIRRVLPRNGTSKATKVALSVAVMVCYHPYNQERAINLSILNMSGINTTSVEALAVGRDMVAHGISINQNHDAFRDPPLAVRWDGPLSRGRYWARHRIGFVVRSVPRTSRCCTTVVVLTKFPGPDSNCELTW